MRKGIWSMLFGAIVSLCFIGFSAMTSGATPMQFKARNIYRINPMRSPLPEANRYKLNIPSDSKLDFSKFLGTLSPEQNALLKDLTVEEIINARQIQKHSLTIKEVNVLLTDVSVGTEDGIISVDDYLKNNWSFVEDMMKKEKDTLTNALASYIKDSEMLNSAKMAGKEAIYFEMQKRVDSKLMEVDSKMQASLKSIESFEREMQVYKWLALILAGLFGADTAVKIMRRRKEKRA
jgi:hypothetical protein